MFGLSFEKLFLIALLAAVVIGPRRLPEYAGHVGRAIRRLRAFVDGARATAAETTGVPLEQWRSVDLSQYDPRRIVREALADDPVAPRARIEAGEAAPMATAEPEVPREPAPAQPSAAPAAVPPPRPPWTDAEVAAVRPGQRVIVVGGSAHPRRIAIADLAEDDPVRRAAEQTEATSPLVEA